MKGIIELIQVVLFAILSVGFLCLLIQSIIVESPIKGVAITALSAMLAGCIYALKITYKEYKAEINH